MNETTNTSGAKLSLIKGDLAMSCSHCGVSKKIVNVSKQLCSACYCRLLRRGTLVRKYVVRQEYCLIDKCHAKTFATNLCVHHYTKANAHKNRWYTVRMGARGEYPRAWDKFAGYLADVGSPPSDIHQLRRIDPTKPWSKDNATWIQVVPRAHTTEPQERKAYAKEWNLRRRFGITGDQYAAMMKLQNGCCAICQEPERSINSNNGKLKELAVDHDHDTGEVRGLLCTACNRTLGYAQEDETILDRAISYLRFHRRPKLKIVGNRDVIDVYTTSHTKDET